MNDIPGREISFNNQSYQDALEQPQKGRDVLVCSFFKSACGFGFGVHLQGDNRGQNVLILQSEVEDDAIPQPGDVLTGVIETNLKGSKLTAIVVEGGKSKIKNLPPQEQSKGVICAYNENKGFGSILAGEGRLFFHVSDVGNILGAKDDTGVRKALRVSTKVRFTKREDIDKGGKIRIRAIAVEVDVLAVEESPQKASTQNVWATANGGAEVAEDIDRQKLEERVKKLEKQMKKVGAAIVAVSSDTNRMTKKIESNHNHLLSVLQKLCSKSSTHISGSSSLSSIKRKTSRERSRDRSTKKFGDDVIDLLNVDDEETDVEECPSVTAASLTMFDSAGLSTESQSEDGDDEMAVSDNDGDADNQNEDNNINKNHNSSGSPTMSNKKGVKHTPKSGGRKGRRRH